MEEVKVGHPDKCPDCGGALVDMYKANIRISTPARICLGCHCLWMDGEKTPLPEDWDKKYPNVAERAREAAEKLLNEAKHDPEFRAKHYFERVFKWAFSEGFTRAYAIFRHKFKEGRFKRIRELWSKTTIEMYGEKSVITGLTTEEMAELSHLINLGKPLSKKPLSPPD